MSAGIDVLIRGAKVVDGSGNPWFFGDVAVNGDRIVDIAPAGSIPADAAARGGRGGGDGRLSGVHRHPEPLDRAADGRRPLPVEGHAGRDDRDHGRGLDSGPDRRSQPRRSATHALRRHRPVARTGHRLDALPLLAGSDGQRGRFTQCRLISGRWHAAPVWAGHGYGTVQRQRDAGDERRHGRGDARWRLRRGLRADLPARHLRQHRGDRRSL